MTKRKYIAPETDCVTVELEQGFMKASVFEGGETNNEDDVTIEQHGFADPDNAWEGNYSNVGWDE